MTKSSETTQNNEKKSRPWNPIRWLLSRKRDELKPDEVTSVETGRIKFNPLTPLIFHELVGIINDKNFHTPIGNQIRSKLPNDPQIEKKYNTFISEALSIITELDSPEISRIQVLSILSTIEQALHLLSSLPGWSKFSRDLVLENKALLSSIIKEEKINVKKYSGRRKKIALLFLLATAIVGGEEVGVPLARAATTELRPRIESEQSELIQNITDQTKSQTYQTYFLDSEITFKRWGRTIDTLFPLVRSQFIIEIPRDSRIKSTTEMQAVVGSTLEDSFWTIDKYFQEVFLPRYFLLCQQMDIPFDYFLQLFQISGRNMEADPELYNWREVDLFNKQIQALTLVSGMNYDSLLLSRSNPNVEQLINTIASGDRGQDSLLNMASQALSDKLPINYFSIIRFLNPTNGSLDMEDVPQSLALNNLKEQNFSAYSQIQAEYPALINASREVVRLYNELETKKNELKNLIEEYLLTFHDTIHHLTIFNDDMPHPDWNSFGLGDSEQTQNSNLLFHPTSLWNSAVAINYYDPKPDDFNLARVKMFEYIQSLAQQDTQSDPPEFSAERYILRSNIVSNPPFLEYLLSDTTDPQASESLLRMQQVEGEIWDLRPEIMKARLAFFGAYNQNGRSLERDALFQAEVAVAYYSYMYHRIEQRFDQEGFSFSNQEHKNLIISTTIHFLREISPTNLLSTSLFLPQADLPYTWDLFENIIQNMKLTASSDENTPFEISSWREAIYSDPRIFDNNNYSALLDLQFLSESSMLPGEIVYRSDRGFLRIPDTVNRERLRLDTLDSNDPLSPFNFAILSDGGDFQALIDLNQLTGFILETSGGTFRIGRTKDQNFYQQEIAPSESYVGQYINEPIREQFIPNNTIENATQLLTYSLNQNFDTETTIPYEEIAKIANFPVLWNLQIIDSLYDIESGDRELIYKMRRQLYNVDVDPILVSQFRETYPGFAELLLTPDAELTPALHSYLYRSNSANPYLENIRHSVQQNAEFLTNVNRVFENSILSINQVVSSRNGITTNISLKNEPFSMLQDNLPWENENQYQHLEHFLDTIKTIEISPQGEMRFHDQSAQLLDNQVYCIKYGDTIILLGRTDSLRSQLAEMKLIPTDRLIEKLLIFQNTLDENVPNSLLGKYSRDLIPSSIQRNGFLLHEIERDSQSGGLSSNYRIFNTQDNPTELIYVTGGERITFSLRDSEIRSNLRFEVTLPNNLQEITVEYLDNLYQQAISKINFLKSLEQQDISFTPYFIYSAETGDMYLDLDITVFFTNISAGYGRDFEFSSDKLIRITLNDNSYEFFVDSSDGSNLLFSIPQSEISGVQLYSDGQRLMLDMSDLSAVASAFNHAISSYRR